MYCASFTKFIYLMLYRTYIIHLKSLFKFCLVTYTKLKIHVSNNNYTKLSIAQSLEENL